MKLLDVDISQYEIKKYVFTVANKLCLGRN